MQTWEEKIIEREKALADGIAIGEERGIAIGKQEGIDTATLSAIRNLMANLNLPAEKAMEALAVPLEDRDRYLKPFVQNAPFVRLNPLRPPPPNQGEDSLFVNILQR